MSCSWKMWIWSQPQTAHGWRGRPGPDCPSPSTMVSSSGSQPPSVFVIQQDRSAGERGALCSSSWRSQSTPSLSGQSSFWEPRISGPAPPLSGFRRDLGQMRCLEFLQRGSQQRHSFYSLGFPRPKREIRRSVWRQLHRQPVPWEILSQPQGNNGQELPPSAGLERGAHADVSCESRTWGPVPGGTQF